MKTDFTSHDRLGTIFVALVILITSASLIPYFVTFSNGFSSDPAHWGAFGSYIGGTIGAVISASALVYSVHSFIAQAKETAFQGQIKHDLEQVNKSERILDSIAFTDLPFVGYARIFSDLQNFRFEDANVVHVPGGFKILEREKGVFVPDMSPLDVLKFFIDNIGLDRAKDVVLENDAIGVDREISRFSLELKNLVRIGNKMINSGFDIVFFKNLYLKYYNMASVLYDLNVLEQEYFESIVYVIFAPLEVEGMTLDVGKYMRENLKLKNIDISTNAEYYFERSGRRFRGFGVKDHESRSEFFFGLEGMEKREYHENE